MELFPKLSLGWLNGWIALALLVLVDGILFLSFPKPVVARLWDRSGYREYAGRVPFGLLPGIW